MCAARVHQSQAISCLHNLWVACSLRWTKEQPPDQDCGCCHPNLYISPEPANCVKYKYIQILLQRTSALWIWSPILAIFKSTSSTAFSFGWQSPASDTDDHLTMLAKPGRQIEGESKKPATWGWWGMQCWRGAGSMAGLGLWSKFSIIGDQIWKPPPLPPRPGPLLSPLYGHYYVDTTV